MASAVSICSDALLMLGANPINSFTEGSAGARLASNLYPRRKLAMMRSHPWNCLMKRVMLAPETTTPAFDYTAQYVMPVDCLRVWQVGRDGEAIDFKVEADRILAEGTALPLLYIANLDEGLWDDLLIEAMTLRMKALMAYAITKSQAVADTAAQEAERSFRMAKTVDGQENPPQTLGESNILTARMTGYNGSW